MTRPRTRVSLTWLTILALLAGTACGAETRTQSASVKLPGPPPTSPYESIQLTTTTTTTPATTTLPPTVSTSGLPIVGGPDGDPEDIKVLQRLLTATCCPLVADGVWGPKTDEAVRQFRTSVGLGTGGLDVALWEAVFTLEPPENYDIIKSELHGVPLPHTAVQLNPGSESVYRYVLAHNTRGGGIATWYRDKQNSVPGWKWCKQGGNFFYFQMSWWQPSSTRDRGPRVTVTVKDVGVGRFNISIGESRTMYVSECAGYASPASTPTATDPPNSSASGSSGSGSSGSGSSGSGSSGSGSTAISSCYVGMNVEKCEDLIGLSAGRRFQYIDCTGKGRNIFFASNWWIIGFWNGIPSVSKSRSGCR